MPKHDKSSNQINYPLFPVIIQISVTNPIHIIPTTIHPNVIKYPTISIRLRSKHPPFPTLIPTK